MRSAAVPRARQAQEAHRRGPARRHRPVAPSSAQLLPNVQVRGRRLRQMRVLVVDDEPAVREVLERILRVEGFEVALANDGREAVRSQAAAPADAVLLDVLMPGLDGLEVCRRMRDTGDRTPVLMLTAREAVGDRVAGLEAGADAYLSQPFALEELPA